MKNQFELFKRYTHNPIITPRDIPYAANTVFNAGATHCHDETVLLLRVEDRRGISHFTVARSKNGFDGWNIDKKPTLIPDPMNYPEELWGIEDPRITYLEKEKTWAVCYTAYSENGPLVSISITDDFKKFTRLGAAVLPTDKDAALLPVKFKGRWAMIHRPVPAAQPSVPAHIWISFSYDLKYWGEHQILMKARTGAWWDAYKIGLAAQPIRTEKGWLIFYHGVKQMVGGDIYRVGAALLALDNPAKVLKRSQEWIFGPRELYERIGDVHNVTFPCGIVQKGDELILYYGAADSSIAVATGSVSRVLSWLDEQG